MSKPNDWDVQSADPLAPPVKCHHDDGADVITGECGRYRFRIEREEAQRSRIGIKKQTIKAPGTVSYMDGHESEATITIHEYFADVSVHHRLTESDGAEFTEEVLHVACALIWSAVRRDQFSGADGGSDSEVGYTTEPEEGGL